MVTNPDMQRTLFFIFLLAFNFDSLQLKAQEQDPFQEAKIEELCFGVLNTDYDEERKQFNQALKQLLKEEVLPKEGAFAHPFSKVKSLGILSSPDSMLRIFNWMVPFSDGSYQYEGLILLKQAGEVKLIDLKPLKNDSVLTEYAILGNKQWPAALYYELIQRQDQFDTYYTLLGWDGHNRLSTKKTIEVIRLKTDGSIQFGAPIFEAAKGKKSRRLFEYSAQHSMRLNYDASTKQIQFDFLAPLKPSLEGVYEYYFPAMTQDAYVWEENRWKFIKLIDTDEGRKREIKKLEKNKKDQILEQDDIYKP